MGKHDDGLLFIHSNFVPVLSNKVATSCQATSRIVGFRYPFSALSYNMGLNCTSLISRSSFMTIYWRVSRFFDMPVSALCDTCGSVIQKRGNFTSICSIFQINRHWERTQNDCAFALCKWRTDRLVDEGAKPCGRLTAPFFVVYRLATLLLFCFSVAWKSTRAKRRTTSGNVLRKIPFRNLSLWSAVWKTEKSRNDVRGTALQQKWKRKRLAKRHRQQRRCFWRHELGFDVALVWGSTTVS